MTTLTTTQREPLLIRAAVTTAAAAVVHLGVLLGVLPISEDAEAEVATTVDAIGLVVLLVWARGSVTSNAKVITRVTTDGQVVAGDASTAATGVVLELGQSYTTGAPVAVAPVKPELVEPTT